MSDTITPRPDKQANTIIDENPNWITLAEQLDVDRYQAFDSHLGWHDGGTPFRPMVLVYLWATVEEYSLSSILRQLEQHSQLAEAFGFSPDELPSNSTCKPVRLDERFSDLERTVTVTVDRTRDVARQRSASISYPPGPIDKNEMNESLDVSERTVQRLLRTTGGVK